MIDPEINECCDGEGTCCGGGCAAKQYECIRRQEFLPSYAFITL